MSNPAKEWARALEDWGFKFVRKGKHYIYRHPCGVQVSVSCSSGDRMGMTKGLMDARKYLRDAGVFVEIGQPWEPPTATKPETPAPKPAPAPIPSAPYPVIAVPERSNLKPINPTLSDFKTNREFCIQVFCFGRWVCLERQRAPSEDRAILQCLPETRDWFTRAKPAGKARIQPQDTHA